MAKYVEFQLGEGAKKPFKRYSGDAGWDLYVSRECVVQPGETMDVHTDISIDMPLRLYGRITGRSSSLRKHSILVNEGIIDNGYSGELFICVHNLGDKPFHVKPGMRLAQILFHVIEDVRWSEVEEISSGKDRGSNGFGSTGV